MNTRLFAAIIAVAGVLLTGCQRNMTGTSDESVVRSAKVYTSSLQPAAGIDVKVYKVDDTLRVPAYQTKTDAAGSYGIEIGKGMYNVLIGDDMNGAFQDSVLFEASYSTLADDTLGRTGALRGSVVLQSIDNPQTAVMQVVGTNKYSNVTQDGRFVIAGLPDGTYLLRATSTKPEYTPTYKSFTINTSVKDTAVIEVELIYTGIPTVRNIRLGYDTLINEVTLSWDTTAYFLFRTFQIYTVDASGANLQLVGTSDRCRYTLHGAAAGASTNFRVGIQSKSLASGPTMETVSVIYRGDILAHFRDTANGTLGKPYTLSMTVENTGNARVVYEWDIGATGTFAPSGGPDTVFTVSGGPVKKVTCIGRATVGGSAVFYDTTTLTFAAGWEKTGEQTFPQQWMEEAVVMSGTLYLFIQEAGPGAKVLWTSTDARNWQKAGPSNLPDACSRPIVYNDKLCIADTNGYLLTSTDGMTWLRGAAPICSTFVAYGSAFGPAGNRNFSPQLFIVNNRLHVRPNTGTVQGDSVYCSDDLVNWKDSKIRYSLNVGDYSPMADTTLVCGYSSLVCEWRLGLIIGTSLITMDPAYDFQTVPSPQGMRSYSFDASDYNCYNRNKMYYVFTDDNPLFVWDTGSRKWIDIALPTGTFGQSFQFVMFNGKILAIGSDGIFTMSD